MRWLFLLLAVAAVAQEPTFQNLSELPAPEAFSIKPKKSVTTATILSSIFPGLGHFYLDDAKTAGALLGTASMELGAVYASLHEKKYNDAFFFSTTFSNTISYSLFASYRDARAYNGQSGYQYKMPSDQLSDLTAAPVNWRVIKKPEVWGGFLGALAVGLCVNYFAFPEDARIDSVSQSEEKMSPWYPILALPVGIGEESLFRGFLQSYFCEKMGPWGSIATSSLLFGAAHVPNAMLIPKEHRWRYFSFSLPLITSIGAYLGWLTQKNTSLKESVALHTWYDFTLFTAAAVAQSAAIGCPSFSYGFSF